MAKRKKLNNGDIPLGDQSLGWTASDDRIRARIAERAYQLYEKRGCIPGHDAEDWLDAERLVLGELSSQVKKSSKSLGRRKNQPAAE
jgi:Protein of unknown function (DUF2934)